MGETKGNHHWAFKVTIVKRDMSESIRFNVKMDARVTCVETGVTTLLEEVGKGEKGWRMKGSTPSWMVRGSPIIAGW